VIDHRNHGSKIPEELFEEKRRRKAKYGEANP
jgi:hypothetical protein